MIPAKVVVQVETVDYDSLRFTLKVYIDGTITAHTYALADVMTVFTKGQFTLMCDMALAKISDELRAYWSNNATKT